MGRRIFQHRGRNRWDLFPGRRRVLNSLFENECTCYLQQLKRQWSGTLDVKLRNKLESWISPRHARKPVKIVTVMISCAQRDNVRRQTLGNLARTDWDEEPLIQFDDARVDHPVQRQLRSTFKILTKALEQSPDYILFLEDDLLFNSHFRHNIFDWSPVKTGTVTVASLYNPGVLELASDFKHRVRVVHPNSVYGSQAFLISTPTAKYLLKNWDEGGAGQDLKIARLAGRLKKPIFYHAPSLVQHVGLKSIWGGRFHQAADFDPDWKA